MNLREQKGYTYGARSWFEFRLGPGPFQMSASVQTEVTADAIVEAVAEMAALRGARPITPAELDTARATLTQGLSAQLRDRRPDRALGGAAGAVRAARRLLRDLRAADGGARRWPRCRSAAAGTCIPSALVTVVVGDAERVGPTLGALDLGPPRRHRDAVTKLFPAGCRISGSNAGKSGGEVRPQVTLRRRDLTCSL